MTLGTKKLMILFIIAASFISLFTVAFASWKVDGSSGLNINGVIKTSSVSEVEGITIENGGVINPSDVSFIGEDNSMIGTVSFTLTIDTTKVLTGIKLRGSLELVKNGVRYVLEERYFYQFINMSLISYNENGWVDFDIEQANIVNHQLTITFKIKNNIIEHYALLEESDFENGNTYYQLVNNSYQEVVVTSFTANTYYKKIGFDLAGSTFVFKLYEESVGD